MSGAIDRWSATESDPWADPAIGTSSNAPGAGDAQGSIVKLVRDRMHGRWAWTAALGIVLAGAAALAGWKSTAPEYRSEGAIHIAPRLTAVLDPIQETGTLPHWQSFVATQVQYLRSPRVLARALENEKVRALSWSAAADALEMIEENLEVRSDRVSEIVQVFVDGATPVEAQAICAAVLESYFEIHGRVGNQETSATLQRLYDWKKQLEREVRTVRGDIQLLHARHRTTDLQTTHAAVTGELEEIEKRLALARTTLQRREQAGETDASSSQEHIPELSQLEATDPRLVDARRRLDDAQSTFAAAQQRYKENSLPWRRAQETMELARTLFEQQYQASLANWRTLGTAELPMEGLDLALDNMPLAALRTETENLGARVVELRQSGEQLIADLQTLTGRQFEAERLQQDLDRTNSRIQGLELEEESIASRISIAQEATRPSRAFSDGRRNRAMAGGAFGFAVSFALFFVIGSIDRRAYAVEQITGDPGQPITCLGVLPDLTTRSSEGDAEDVASHCVHQIRNQIDARRNPGESVALALSSPFQGDGKTSITLSLAWSYAGAGYRTVLVDCDLVSRSLTRQLGFEDASGLREAVAARSFKNVARELSVPNLSAVPAGKDLRVGPETLRQMDVQALLEALRPDFDVILIDTGPMLGSLESLPVTKAADAVVLSIRRGRSRARLQECIDRLRSSGAHFMGMVLNCVDRSACSRYVSEASLADPERATHRSQSSDESMLRPGTDGRTSGLVRAMEVTRRVRGGAA